VRAISSAGTAGAARRSRASIRAHGSRWSSPAPFTSVRAAATPCSGPTRCFLGKRRRGYEYSHVDDGGDRSMVFEYDPALLDEIARSLGVPASFGRAAMTATPAAWVLARRRSAAVMPRPCARPRWWRRHRLEALVATSIRTCRHWSGAQAGRVARSLRFVEAHSAGDCSLEMLARHGRPEPLSFPASLPRGDRTDASAAPHRDATALGCAGASRGRASPSPRSPSTSASATCPISSAASRAPFGVSPRAYRRRA